MGGLTRRLLWLGSFAALAGMIALSHALLEVNLRPADVFSGWLSLAMIAALMLLNGYKRLSFLPLGSAAGWLRLHVFGGLLLCLPVALHVDLATLDGSLEWLLAGLFAAVTVSGLLGWWLSWQLPRRLTDRSENVAFERIPALRLALAKDIERLVMDDAARGNSTLISDFYRSRLAKFFARHKHFFYHLRHSERPRRALLAELDGLHRYANAAEKKTLLLLARQVIAKYNLDHHYTLQSVLKGWLFVHVPLSYALLLFSLAHAAAAYVFLGRVG